MPLTDSIYRRIRTERMLMAYDGYFPAQFVCTEDTGGLLLMYNRHPVSVQTVPPYGVLLYHIIYVSYY